MKYSVRKVIAMCFVLLFCSIIMAGCNASEQKTSDFKQVKIVVADDAESAITYCDDYIQSASGGLYVTNCSEYPVSLLLVRQDKGKTSDDKNEEITVSLDEKETKLIENCDEKYLMKSDAKQLQQKELKLN